MKINYLIDADAPTRAASHATSQAELPPPTTKTLLPANCAARLYYTFSLIFL